MEGDGGSGSGSGSGRMLRMGNFDALAARYRLDQVKAMEREMLARIELAGLIFEPRIIIVTRLIPVPPLSLPRPHPPVSPDVPPLFIAVRFVYNIALSMS